MAAKNGHTGALKLLIDAKNPDGITPRVDLNKTKPRGATPAYIAAQNGQTETLKLLINATNPDGITPRVDLNKTIPGDGVTPAFIATQNDHTEALKLIVAAQRTPAVDLNKPRMDGLTPVLIAVMEGHTKALKILVAANDRCDAPRVDLNITLQNGATPLFIAAQDGHEDIIIELLNQGVDTRLSLKSSVTDLRQFAQSKVDEVIQRMNQFIEDKSATHEILISPKDIAWIMGHNKIVQNIRNTYTSRSKTFK